MAIRWVLTGNLVALQEQLTQRFPQRKLPDGTIGDQAHADRKSGHNPDITGNPEWRDGDTKNEVRSLDVDVHLNDRWGFNMSDVITHMCALGRIDAGFPIRYIMYAGFIFEASYNWRAKPIDPGKDQHFGHAHFSGARWKGADEAINYNYHFELLLPKEEDVEAEDIKKIGDEVWHRNVHASGPTKMAWVTLDEIHADVSVMRETVFKLRNENATLRSAQASSSASVLTLQNMVTDLTSIVVDIRNRLTEAIPPADTGV